MYSTWVYMASFKLKIICQCFLNNLGLKNFTIGQRLLHRFSNFWCEKMFIIQKYSLKTFGFGSAVMTSNG